jgi:hypothetical protein
LIATICGRGNRNLIAAISRLRRRRGFNNRETIPSGLREFGRFGCDR